MKLGKQKMLMLSFMLFSLFFGAGNLIFPPFLGQSAGENTPIAIAAFLITAVLLPVLGVVVVAEFDGLDKLANRVNGKFALVFTILIYLSIGPGLGIPRAASVPFEMAVIPYLPQGTNTTLYMLLYSAVFFLIAGWLAMTPSKLVERIGKILSPTLLVLLVFLFVNFVFRGETAVVSAVGDYQTNPVVKGFLEGYQTMDTIAALNFGLVIALTLGTLGVKEKKDVMHYTVRAGINAGIVLSLVYLMLSYIGMKSSGIYELQDNGAWTLRAVVYQLFGDTGAILLATIFTLACLTTCVGLITSISQFFAKLFTKVQYHTWVILIVVFSVIICNQGLTTILSISVPVLDAIYPVSIVLIALGLSDKHLKNNPYIYPVTIGCVGVVSVLRAAENIKIPMGIVGKILYKLPLYKLGLGWVPVAAVTVIATIIVWNFKSAKNN